MDAWVYFDVGLLVFVIVWVQNRGFKTMRSKTRHLPSDFEGPVDGENYTPAFMKVSKLHDTEEILVKAGLVSEIQQKCLNMLFCIFFSVLRASLWRKSETWEVLNSYWNRITCQNLNRMLLRPASQRASWKLRLWHRELKVMLLGLFKALLSNISPEIV